MPYQKLVDQIFGIAKQIEDLGGLNEAASLRRSAKIFELKYDQIMLERCIETAKLKLSAIKKKNEDRKATR